MSLELSRRSQSAALRVIRQWQSPTEEIRHAPDPMGVRIAVWTLALVLAGSLAATPFIPIERVVTSSSGDIVSIHPLTTIQALDPSIIRSIDVKPGQEVATGQVLATLDPTVATSDVVQMQQTVTALDAEIARCRAEMAGTAFAVPPALPPGALPAWSQQKALFDQRASSFASQAQSFDEKIRTTEATVVKLQGDETRYTQREAITRQVEDMRDTLYKSGASSLVSLLQSTDARLQLLQSLDDGHNGLIAARHQLAAQKADREAFVQGWEVALDQELVTALNGLDSAAASLEKARRHEDLVRFTAPEPSVVLSVSKLSTGSVLAQGDEILRLAPLDGPVEAEIHILARDIGFVRPGDPVAIKVDAYNSYEHGEALGHLGWISENAFTQDDDAQPLPPFYKARVAIDALHFTDLPPTLRLAPGMTLQADIGVGSRSVFRYIMGGFFHGTGEQMRGP